MGVRLEAFRSPRKRILAAIAVIGLIAAACGGGGETATGDSATGEPAMDESTADESTTGEFAPDDEAILFEGGVIQPLSDGFPSREISLVVVDDPGTRDAIYAVNMAEALSAISPVNVVVTYETAPQGGTLPILSDLERRPGGPEGYYPVVVVIPGTVTDFHVEPITREFGISLEDVSFLIASESQPYTFAQRKDAPWGLDFLDFIAYAQANPGELRYLATSVGGGNDIAMEWLLDGLGITVNKIPAGGHQEALSAIGAGEGDFTLTRPELARQFEVDGRVDITFQMNDELSEPWASEPGSDRIATTSIYSELNIPDISFGLVLGMMTSSDVPLSHQRWLSELFLAGVATPGWQDRLTTVAGLDIFKEPWDRERANREAALLYESTEPVVRRVGLHWEDN